MTALGAYPQFWELETGPSPAEQLRGQPADAKQAGEVFDLAYQAALERIDWGSLKQGREWQTVLKDADVVAAFFAAYSDLPDPAQAVSALAGAWEELEASADDDREWAARRLAGRTGSGTVSGPGSNSFVTHRRRAA